MPVEIKKLLDQGVQIYPQTIGQAVYIESEGKTLDAVIATLKSKDVIVDASLNATSGNAIANKAVVAGLATKMDTATFNAKVGVANGIAPLDADKKIASGYLPSYVDDVIELSGFITATSTTDGVYYNSVTKKIEEYQSVMPGTSEKISSNTPEGGKIYINLMGSKTYRWGGSDMVVISETIALGETASTAYPGNKGKANADAIKVLDNKVDDIEYIQSTHADALGNITNEVSNAKTDIATNAKGISALQTSLTTEKGKITTLQGQMTSANATIGSHTTSINSLSSSIGTTNGNVTSLGTRVTSIEGKYVAALKVGSKTYNEIPAGIYT